MYSGRNLTTLQRKLLLPPCKKVVIIIMRILFLIFTIILVSCNNVMKLPLCSFKHEKMEGADLPEILVNFCSVTSQKTLFLMPVYKLKYASHSRTTNYFEERVQWWIVILFSCLVEWYSATLCSLLPDLTPTGFTANGVKCEPTAAPTSLLLLNLVSQAKVTHLVLSYICRCVCVCT